MTGERLGDKSYVDLTLSEGVLSQWVFGVYNYEGGNGRYVLTGGDRSITDPEPYELAQEDTADSGETAGNILLYVGVGLAAIAACAAAALVIVKKKKAGKNTGSTTKE